MKKLLITGALLAAVAIPVRAEAVVPAAPAVPISCQLGLCGASAASMSLGSNVGGMLAAFTAVWVFPYLNTTGERPFEDTFGVNGVEYRYPHDPAGYSEAYAHMKPEKVSYHTDHKPYHVRVNGVDTIRSD